jgi:hypothetical protein
MFTCWLYGEEVADSVGGLRSESILMPLCSVDRRCVYVSVRVSILIFFLMSNLPLGWVFIILLGSSL